MQHDSQGITIQACKHCGTGAPADAHFCPKCDKILSLVRHGDYFAFLGLPRTLRIDPKDLDHYDPAVMRDLQRSCIMCDEKGRCRFDIANGVITEKFRDYCPNAFTLDALLKAKQERRRARRRRP